MIDRSLRILLLKETGFQINVYWLDESKRFLPVVDELDPSTWKETEVEKQRREVPILCFCRRWRLRIMYHTVLIHFSGTGLACLSRFCSYRCNGLPQRHQFAWHLDFEEIVTTRRTPASQPATSSTYTDSLRRRFKPISVPQMSSAQITGSRPQPSRSFSHCIGLCSLQNLISKSR